MPRDENNDQREKARVRGPHHVRGVFHRARRDQARPGKNKSYPRLSCPQKRFRYSRIPGINTSTYRLCPRSRPRHARHPGATQEGSRLRLDRRTTKGVRRIQGHPHRRPHVPALRPEPGDIPPHRRREATRPRIRAHPKGEGGKKETHHVRVVRADSHPVALCRD